MQKHTLLAVSVFLLGGLATMIPPVAHAQERVAPITGAPASRPYQTSQQLNQLLDEGRNLVDAGDFSDAIVLYQQAATLAPKNSEIFSGIGYLQALQGNFPAATAAYRQAVALAPKNANFLYALGYSLGKSGDNAGAAAAYRRALQLNHKDINAYLGLGVVLFRQGKYNDALKVYQQVVAIAPNNPRAYELRGAILRQQGQSREAIAALSRARDLYKQEGYMGGVQRAEAMLQQLHD
jgi:Flp pilus assembly protein TadD